MPTHPLFRLFRPIVLGVLAAAPAFAQTPAAPPCPKAAEVQQAHMLGLWRAEFQGLWQGATLLLEKHAEDAGRLSGAANRNGERALLAGEVHRGEFNMEESSDGRRITAIWTGDVVEGSCGREIRGVWQEEKDPPKPYPFVLRKQP